jgi:outer-membrane receptor for ferric coprogen and ferric-rhodotorulic acid
MVFSKKSLLSFATILALSNTMLMAKEKKKEDIESIGTVDVISHSNVTENSDLYTIFSMGSATKMDLSLLETPQSVSVVTSAQMEDFALDTLDDALDSVTGIDVATIEQDRTFFTSRGFDVTNILTDGVGGSLTSNIYINGDIDMALYDHVEVTRGATGLTSNHGDPSATINLIRKRPTKKTQVSAKATLGSWSKKRIEGDVSGSLNEEKTIRARIIGALEGSESYLDRYESKTNTFGLIFDGDIGKNTVLTVGMTRVEDNNDGTQQGGIDAVTANSKDYDVSTSAAPDWAFRDVTTLDAFLELDSALSDTWKLKTTYAYKGTKQDSQWLTVWNDDDGNGTYLENFSKVDEDSKEHLFDITLNNIYNLNGRDHELVFGLNHTRQDYTEDVYRDSGSYGTYVDLDSWDGSTSSADFGSTPSYFADWTLKETSFFAATNYNILDNLSLLAGTKLTKYSQEGYSYSELFKEEESGIFTPYVSLLYKINDKLSTYASYTTTFNPQSNVNEDGTRLDPEEGKNYELGLKSLLFDDSLNLSFSIYKVEQNNVAAYAGWDSTYGRSYYTAEEVITKGFDVEVAGKLTDEINTLLGYTHLSSIKNDEGDDTSLYMPRDLLKVSLTYSPLQINGLKLGASANYKGKTDNGRSGSSYLEQDSYTIYNLMASYKIDKQTKLSFNAKNITDEKYYNNLVKPYVTYGTPRNFGVSFEYKF